MRWGVVIEEPAAKRLLQTLMSVPPISSVAAVQQLSPVVVRDCDFDGLSTDTGRCRIFLSTVGV